MFIQYTNNKNSIFVFLINYMKFAMGINGLTTYIKNHSDRYLKYYELHDTYLVIDGNNICCQIYTLYAKCNCVFGGDYDIYAQCVSNFFDDLLKCNVTPLVLFDGGYENKKLKTIITRIKEKMRTASCFCPVSQQKMKFFPLLLRVVFKDVLREKNIRCVQCLFEADNIIATVARILNCPVLSYDSDFYIYGTSYIPFYTLDNYTVKSSTAKGYVKRCQIYKVEYLLNSFKGLNQLMLPLAAVLLGNDYVKHSTFKNFFRHLKLQRASSKKHNNQQRRIEATFIWLSKYTLDEAIIAILSRLTKSIRQKILNLIETNINSYMNASAEILIPLGFSKDYVTQVNTHHLNTIFKFHGDINNLTYIKETCKESNNETSEEEDEIETMDTLNESESMSTDAFVSNLPAWFVNEFLMAKYAGYFMDLITRRLYICPVQIEDYCCPSSIIISLKIISIIFTFLKSGIDDKIRYMTYMTRDENKRLAHYKLEGTGILCFHKLPSLSDLRKVPLIIRRTILDNTLELTNTEYINELPPEWMLYVACVKYWIEHQDPSKKCKSYVYSVFVCMLFNIIDSKIGKFRKLYYFQNKYSQKIQIIQQKRKANSYKPHGLMNITITEAFNEIDSDDCLLAAPFFISRFEMNRKLYTNPKKFNRSIVHVFAEFQSCLNHSMDLNALLGYPYPQTKVADLFNGTLLYNLCSSFQKHHDIETYINYEFQKSPSLLRFFNILLLKLKPLFPILLQNEINLCKKQKTKYKHSKRNQHLAETDSEYVSADDNLHDEPQFYDENNFFSVLSFK